MEIGRRLNPENVVQARRAWDYTQAAVAVKLGMGLRTYQRYESGEHVIPKGTLEKLSAILETPVDVLCQEEAHLPSKAETTPNEQPPSSPVLSDSEEVGPPPPLGRPATNRSNLLRNLDNIYTRRLEDFKAMRGGRTPLSLRFHQRSDLTHPARVRSQRTPLELALPEGTTIRAVYDQAGKGLLILGKPGAGKTMLLYQLAKRLVENAKRNATVPVPVILDLAPWNPDQPSFLDWSVHELEHRYQLPAELTRAWLQSGRDLYEEPIQLFLDGLDEVETAHQPACVAAINAYYKTTVARLVVCSQLEVYESLARDPQQQLLVPSAVIIQPLTAEQVDSYLAPRSLHPLREAMQANPDRSQFVNTPLMVCYVLALEGEQISAAGSVAAIEQQMMKHLLQKKIVAMHRSLLLYSEAQLQTWLIRLAQHLQQQHKKTFYLEELQPDWLPEGRSQALYNWLGVRLPAILIGLLITCLVNGFFFREDFSDLLVHSVPGAVIGGLLSYQSTMAFGVQQQRQLWHASLKRAVTLALGVGVAITFVDWERQSPYFLWGGAIFASWTFLMTVLFSSPLLRMSPPLKQHPGAHLRRAQRRLFRDGLLIGVLAAISWGLVRAFTDGLREGFSAAFAFGMSYTMSGVFIGFILLQTETTVLPAGRMERSWIRIRQQLFRRVQLERALLMGLGTFLCLGLSYGVSYGLRYGPSIGLGYLVGFGLCYAVGFAGSSWLLAGLFQGVVSQNVPILEKAPRPNEEIRRSLRNGCILGLLGGGISAVVGGGAVMLSAWLSVTVSSTLLPKTPTVEPWPYALVWGGITGCLLLVTAGIIIGLSKGGLAWWRHWVIRFLLWQRKDLPWRVIPLLDAGARHKVLAVESGGGHSFDSKVLRDYLLSLL